MKTVGIMQPYFLPYLGYFHLIEAVDVFVIYDDIQYTKKGWINRNRLLFNKNIEYVTLPLTRASDFLSVKERMISPVWIQKKNKYLRKIEESYRKRKNFNKGMDLCEEIFNFDDLNLFNYIYHSLKKICKELGISTEIIKSSSLGSLNSARGKEKVIAICNNISGKKYLNAIGGINLYRKDDFNSAGIDLKFVKSYHSPYQQHTKDFIPGLSIIDIIFSISEKEELHRQIKNFELNDA